MATIYVMSMESFAGKTVFCLGLARKLAGDGLSVGYIRPLTEAAKQREQANTCAAIMKRYLGLTESMDVLNPVMVDGETLDWILSDREVDYTKKMTDAFKIASAGKDVMVAEGVSGLSEGFMIGLDARTTADLLNANCLLLVRPKDEMIADTILSAKNWLRERVRGVVFNAVPRGMVEFVTESLTPYLNRKGVKVYAVIPEDRMLMAVTVRELVDRLGAKVVCAPDHLDTLVENVMVGAMSAENALSYLRRKPHKVVITGGDRPDIQLAALETSTSCLILSGNLNPSPIILGRADELGVPVLISQQDTLTTATLVEQAFTEVQFHEDKKINRYERLLETHLNYDELKRDLELG
jgi:BioD-like phosphotransacetylase family protein